jgi:dihydroorotase
MSCILLKHVILHDPSSTHHLKQKDILIENDRIKKIEDHINSEEHFQVIQREGMHVSPGWMDFRSNFAEPGEEYKEGIDHGLDVAAHAGFTAVCIMPSTHPPMDNRRAVEYVLKRSEGHAVNLFPFGTFSANQEGKDLAEWLDMKQGGAIAFSDDKKNVASNALMFKGLKYAQGLNILLADFPMDLQWMKEGQMHEGVKSTSLGMKGIPVEAETIQLARDIMMLEYTGGRLHVGPISCKESIKMIKAAKKKGLQITSEVCHHHLALTDEKLEEFDSRYKMLPPLRSEEHRKELVKAIKNGTIDIVSSDHMPQDYDEKVLEFGLSSFGVPGLETTFSVTFEALGDLDLTLDTLIRGPRKVLHFNVPTIEEGSIAELTLFDPDLEWVVTPEATVSKSGFSPYLYTSLKGKALGIINKDQVYLNRELIG